MRVVMFVGSERTFRWDWLQAARGCAEVIALEARDDGLEWPSLVGCPFIAQNPEDALHYQFLPARRWLPYRLVGRVADLRPAVQTIRILELLMDRHGSIDLLHTHFYSGARLLPLVKRRLSIPYVITEHSTALTRESPDKKIGRRGLRIAAKVYREAAWVLPVSHSLERAIRGHGLEGRFRVVDNPIDMDVFRVREKQSVRHLPLHLVNVGRLAAVKGQDLLLRAMRRLLDEGLAIRLTIVGEGPFRRTLEQLRRELALQDDVEFAGQRSRTEIARILRSSDVFVLPSRTENLPVAVIEAMACGLPVVATRVGGLPEMLEEGRSGRLVPPEDEGALVDALRTIANELDDYPPTSIASAARSRFSFEAARSALREVYSDVVETPETA